MMVKKISFLLPPRLPGKYGGWLNCYYSGEGQKYLRTEIEGSPRGGEKGNLSRVKDTSNFPILAVSTAGDQIREFYFPTLDRKKMNLSIFL